MLSQYVSMLPLCRITAARLWCGENPVSAPRWWKRRFLQVALTGWGPRWVQRCVDSRVVGWEPKTMPQEGLNLYLLVIIYLPKWITAQDATCIVIEASIPYSVW